MGMNVTGIYTSPGSFGGPEDSLQSSFVSMLTFPVRIAVVAGPLFLSYLSFWVSLLLAIAILAVLSEPSSALIVLYVNAAVAEQHGPLECAVLLACSTVDGCFCRRECRMWCAGRHRSGVCSLVTLRTCFSLVY
jgi:hypothetical protein